MKREYLVEELLNNVLVLHFNRRRNPKKGQIRRMICTKSANILESTQGRFNLNFRNPKFGGPNFNEAEHNVIVVWDILRQDYRLVPCESVVIEQIIPESEFWEFYNDNLYPMSAREKINFMEG